MSDFPERLNEMSPVKRALLALQEMQAKLDAVERSRTEPIAIIGMGCRFPGGANDPDAFWRLLSEGIDGISEVPAGRWLVDDYYDSDTGRPGKMNTRWGGFLDQVDQFDAEFFGISPREATCMDPQQRLALEVAWEALEDGGQAAPRLAGSRTGVFIGICSSDYSWHQFGDPSRIDAYSSTGNSYSIVANRLSYLLDLRGPSVAVDTACSSSLVAVHLACQSLRSRECDLALVGGVNLILSPLGTISLSKWGMMAPDGRCKPFDALADGFVRGEGCGVIVLKRLSDAMQDRDSIRALIRGSAVNQDGRTNGLTAPNVLSQQMVIRQALENAGVAAEEISYIEAHGTGTVLGDPIEVEALKEVLGQGSTQDRICGLGSVKSNIGHLEAAAGIAGLIKVVLSLEHGEIAPNLHFKRLNPNITLDETRFVIPTRLGEWPGEARSRYAGVSSFGFGGTNAHVVVEGYDEPTGSESESREDGEAQLLAISTRGQSALRSLARAYAENLKEEERGGKRGRGLSDICYTAGVRRDHLDHRLAVVGRSRQQMVEGLEAFLQGVGRPEVSVGIGQRAALAGTVFVFSGQGSQWAGMGRGLLEREPVFRDTLKECERAMRQEVEWSLLELLSSPGNKGALDRIDIIQPTLFAVQIALAALWSSWGIEPDAVVGHSMGEVAAAFVAGALTLEDAVRVICRRSHLLRRASGKGAMAVVGLSMEQSLRALAGHEDRLSVAVSNSPTSTVLSGDPVALGTVLDALQRQDVFCRLVNVDVAYHSPQMDELREDLLAVLNEINPRSPRVPMYSTVSGGTTDGLRFDGAYWMRNVRQPVLFSTAVQRLLENDQQIFLELSPHPLLLPAVEQIIRHVGKDGLTLPSLRREEDERSVMLGSLGTLYSHGYAVDWGRLYSRGGRCVRLPAYPWQRERFWPDEPSSGDSTKLARFFKARRGGRRHPMLGEHMKSAVHPGTHFWSIDLSTTSFPFLNDHRVQETAILPAAAYAEMALVAAMEAFGPGQYILQDLAFERALFLPDDGSARTVQLVISGDVSQSASLQLFSLQAGPTQAEATWVLHATGTIALGGPEERGGLEAYPRLGDIKGKCTEALSGADHYQVMRQQGLQYGPCFQGIEQIWRREGEAVARLQIPEQVKSEAAAFQLHPAVLDACFQVLAAVPSQKLLNTGNKDSHVLVGVDRFEHFGEMTADETRQGESSTENQRLLNISVSAFSSRLPIWVHAVMRPKSEEDLGTMEGDVIALDESGRLIFRALGMRARSLDVYSQRTAQENPCNWLYELEWKSESQPAHSHEPRRSPENCQPGTWMIFCDRSGVGERLGELLKLKGDRYLLVRSGRAEDRGGGTDCWVDPARPEDFSQLVESSFWIEGTGLRRVVHLWGLDAEEPAILDDEKLRRAQAQGCGSALRVLQAMVRAAGSESSRLWLVTRNAQAVEGTANGISVAQAPLWGLGRVIALEHPEVWGGLVDLDGELSTADAARLLLDEVGQNGAEDQVAYRGEQRYVVRLMRRDTRKEASERLRFRSDGAYLIVGGLGGLGLAVARWVAQRGARHLVLAGRQGAAEGAHAALEELQATGARVVVTRVDVAERDQVERMVGEIESEKPLRGVIHAAGVLEDGILAEQKWERFDRVFAPKVQGAWNLHELTRSRGLDFFVLFSSMASVMGSPGQGNHAAANAFLDALAHYRRRQGLPALCINWGAWAEVGAAAERKVEERARLRGIGTISVQQGLQLLEMLLQKETTQVGVLPVDWRRFGATAVRSRLFADLLRTESHLGSQTGSPGASAGLSKEMLLAAEPGDRQRVLEEYLRDQVAKVLRLSSPSKLNMQQPLTNLGIDSLMAIELRTQVQADLGVIVPIVSLLKGPSLEQLTKQFLQQLELDQLLDATCTKLTPPGEEQDWEVLRL